MSQKRHECTIQHGTQSLSYVSQKSSNLSSLCRSAYGSFPQERVIFLPVFMVRMQSLYVSRKRACVYPGNLNLIYFGSMANNTVCACVSVYEIHKYDSFHRLKQVLLQAGYLPHHSRISLWVVRQLRWNWAKFAWYGHSEKLNYNCHLFSLTGLNCTWCVMAPALLEIARNDLSAVCSPREISAEWNDEGKCLKSDPFDRLQNPVKRQDLSCYGDFVTTI